MKDSLTLRLTLRFAVLITLTTGLVLFAGGWLLERQAVSTLRQLHEIEGEELSEILGERKLSAAEVPNRIAYDADSDAALFLIQIRDDAGNVVFRSANLGGLLLPVLQEHERDWEAELPGVGRVLISEYRGGPWRIQIASRLDPIGRMLRDYGKVSVGMLCVVLMMSLAIGYRFSQATLEPVRAIEATARRIRGDNLSERIPEASGHGELTALIMLLNDTFDRLQRSFEQVQRFTADASHELKTPLALARLNAEKLREHVGNSAGAELLGNVLEEIARLNRIIESLLFLAKTESGALQLPRRSVDLVQFCTEFAADATVLAEEAGVEFVLGRNEPGTLLGEPGLLRQLLLNLVSNALAVAPPGSAVTLDSCREHGQRVWTVGDEGPGLPPEQLDKVFQRFARFHSPMQEPKAGGNGLGLTLCRSIAELHGGTVIAENREGGRGLTVRVTLPEA